MSVFQKVYGKQAKDTIDRIEIHRIVSLPVRDEMSEEELEVLNEAEVDASYFQRGFRLFPCQLSAYMDWLVHDGVFGPIGVGHGKTAITLIIADRAFRIGRSRRSVIFLPPQVYSQLTQRDIPWARKRLNLSVPFHLVGGRNLTERRMLAASGKVGCYIMPYSLLSTRDSEALMGGDGGGYGDGISPDLVILDEAHCVKNYKAARTSRLMRYIDKHEPSVVALSGTITSKSVMDYHHLITACLGKRSPVPLPQTLAQSWAEVLDPDYSGGEPGRTSGTGPLEPLMKWAGGNFPDKEIPAGVPGFRVAYKTRLVTAPGVVASGDREIGTSIVITNRPVPKPQSFAGHDKVVELMKQVTDLWLTPAGDEIEYGFHKWRHLFELSAGFYHNLRWPEPEELERTGLSLEEAKLYIDAAKAHHAALQEYHRVLRNWLQGNNRPGLDTPNLVGTNMHHHGARDVGDRLYRVWKAAKDMVFQGMPERISEPVRVCPYKILTAMEWAEKLDKGAIIWYLHDPVGEWAYDTFRDGGLDVIWCPSESRRKGSNDRIADPRNKDKIVVAGWGAHSTGKNLQHFEEQCFLQVPREAAVLEQVLGRLHREGQQADSLSPMMFNTTDFDHQNLWACLVDALYIAQTTGVRHRAVYAGYDPMPRMFPPDFLRERGFDRVPVLDREMRREIAETFGQAQE